MNNKSFIFKSTGKTFKKSLAYLSLCLVLVLGTSLFSLPNKAQQVLTSINSPIYWLANLPTGLWTWFQGYLHTHQTLINQISELNSQVLSLSVHQSNMKQIKAENRRLRQLLNSPEASESRVLISELMGIIPSYGGHRVIINQGSQNGAYTGQMVLDRFGLFGRLIAVSKYTSQVLLISDIQHALPVYNTRNGFRAIAQGTGHFNQLTLRHVPETVDIRPGDQLVTSGLAKHFPKGYPVGIVQDIKPITSTGLKSVTVKISATLESSSELLLIFNSSLP